MLILSVETSCDETSIAILRNNIVLCNIVASQIETHQIYGGVVPEIASRLHFKLINQVYKKAIMQSKIKPYDLDIIAYTKTPGLIGCLKIGQIFAESIAFLLKKPIYGINHLHGHLYAGQINDNIVFPALGLIVSGGHTALYYLSKLNQFELLGSTIDDAAGECLDKVGRKIGLPYPAGPEIEKHANLPWTKTIESKFNLPIVRVKQKWHFSFSGLKTSAIHLWQLINSDSDMLNHFCYLLQTSVIDYLIRNTKSVLDSDLRIKTLVLGGGVTANQALRKKFMLLNKKYKIKLIKPKQEYCTDNAAMIGIVAYFKHLKKLSHDHD